MIATFLKKLHTPALPISLCLGVVAAIAVWSLYLPQFVGWMTEDVYALTFGTPVTVTSISNSNGAVIETLEKDGVYYVAFVSSTDGIYYGYLTTSTDGATWSSPANLTGPLAVTTGVEYIYGFDFKYLENESLFALLYHGTSTGIGYATSSDGSTWTSSSIASIFSFTDSGRSHRCDAGNGSGMGYSTTTGMLTIACSTSFASTDMGLVFASSSDGGITWATSTVEGHSTSTYPSGAEEVQFAFSGGPSNEVIHMVYAFAESSGERLTYASSSDGGATFTTTTISSENLAPSVFGSVTQGFGLVVTSSGRAYVTYPYVNAADFGSFTVTSSIVAAIAQGDGTFVTSTAITNSVYTYSMSVGLLQPSKLYLTDEGSPFFIYFDEDTDVNLFINTSTWQGRQIESGNLGGPKPSAFYSTSTGEAAVAYSVGGTMKFTTTTLVAVVSAPTAPSGLATTTAAATSIGLSWTDNSDNEDNFIIDYNTANSFPGTTTTAAANATSATISSLTPNTQYFFRIAAENSGGTSSYDTLSGGTWTGAPTPSGVSATAASQTSITVSWTSDTSTSYILQNVTDSTTSSVSGTSSTVTGLTCGTSYTFRVAGLNAIGVQGSYSSSASVSTSACPSSGGGGGASRVALTAKPTLDDPSATIRINNGAASTNQTTVTVSIPSSDATEMAISNRDDFAGASFVPVASSVTHQLAPGNGEKSVYVKLRKSSGGTLTLLDTITLTGQSLDAPADPNGCVVPVQQAYKSPASSAVYYVTEQCAKRPFKNATTYFTYFTSWNDVVDISSATLGSIPNDTLGFMPWGPLYDPKYGALIKTPSDPRVYLLLNDEKYWITDEAVFEGLNYQWNWIEDADARLLDNYTTASEIDYTDHHPNYTIVKYAADDKVYRIEEGANGEQVKRWIPDEDAFNALNFRWDRIVTIPDEETYPDGPDLQ